MLGGALVPSLRAMGHEVHTLVRRPVQNANEIEWDPAAGKLDAAQLKGITLSALRRERRGQKSRVLGD